MVRAQVVGALHSSEKVATLAAGRLQGWLRPLGGVVLFGAMGAAACSGVDDLLIYRQCSREAMERAGSDPRLVEALGGPLRAGPWYEATISVAPKGGHAASATFPIVGTRGTASVHLRALRFQGGRSTLWYNTLGPGRWELMTLEATVPPGGATDRAPARTINLMQATDDPKPGDSGSGPCGPPQDAHLAVA